MFIVLLPLGKEHQQLATETLVLNRFKPISVKNNRFNKQKSLNYQQHYFLRPVIDYKKDYFSYSLKN